MYFFLRIVWHFESIVAKFNTLHINVHDVQSSDFLKSDKNESQTSNKRMEHFDFDLALRCVWHATDTNVAVDTGE